MNIDYIERTSQYLEHLTSSYVGQSVIAVTKIDRAPEQGNSERLTNPGLTF